MSIASSWFILAAAVAVAGCESPEGKAREAAEAQRAADQNVVQVIQTTEEKAVLVQQKADEDIARLVHQADQKIGEAERRADRKDNDATQALWLARDEAREDSARKLDGLDHDVAALRPRLEKTLSSAVATSVEQDLEAKTTALRKSIRALDQSNADDLDSLKKSIHAGFADLAQALAEAKKRV